jgi:hypothetical protein
MQFKVFMWLTLVVLWKYLVTCVSVLILLMVMFCFEHLCCQHLLFFFLLYLRLNLCDVTMAVHFIHWEICQYLPFLPNMFISFHYGFQWNSQIYFACIDSPNRPRPSSCQDSTITPWQTTLAITPLDEWSARCRDIYLITHSIHKKQTSMPTARFELTIPAS